jgi:SAM-dependent methyltransferase
MVATPDHTTVNVYTGNFVQFGCGLCAPSHWQNFDASPALIVQHLPIIGPLVPKGPFGGYPATARYGDILKGLPIKPDSVDLLYCSHVLEHMTAGEAHIALTNSYRYLKPGGIFRLVLPDLEALAQEYLSSNNPDAVHQFMRLTWLGEDTSQRSSWQSTLKQWMSRGRHLWMWDYKAMAHELASVGFQDIRRAKIGDSGLEAFDAVEDPERWTYELGIQCIK